MAQALNVGAIYYEVEADTSRLVNSSGVVDGSLDRLTRTMGRTDAAADQLGGGFNKVAAGAKRFGREAEGATSSVSGLARAIGGLLTLRAIGELIGMAEGYNEMAERVRMATSSQEEFDMVQRRLLQTANGTYRAMSEAQEVYIRTADSLRSMGYSTEQVLDITDSLSYAFVTNAASSDRANSAISAFSKSINKGKVDVEAWESIIAAVPSVIGDIATASGKTTAEIRELGASGKITAQMLNEGLRQSLDANKKAADDMLTTVKDAFVNLRNSLSAYLHEANTATGATGALSKSIIVLGENIDTVVRLLMTVGAGALAAYIASTGAAAIASAKAMLAARAQALEELNLARAQAAATAAALARARAQAGLTMTIAQATAAEHAHAAALARVAAAQRGAAATGGTLLGVLGGPVGLIALAASVGAALYLFRDGARDAKQSSDLLAGSVAELGSELLKLNDIQLSDAITEMERLAEQMRRNIAWSEKYARDGGDSAGSKQFQERLQKERAALEQTLSELEAMQRRRAEIEKELQRRGQAVSASGPGPERDPDAEKRLQDLREELHLLKLQGEARAKLKALQKLGDNASAEQRKEAEKLAAEIYRLEEAEKKLKTTSKEGAKEQKKNAAVIEELGQALAQAALSGEELAVAKAKAKLEKAATPEEIDEVERLARELYRATEGTQLLMDLENQLATRRQQYQRDLDAMGMGSRARELNAELARVEDAYQGLINQRRGSAQGLSDAELEAIRGAMDRELEMVREHYAAREQIEQDWKLGAVNAVRDYVDQASNLYTQVGDAVGNAFRSAEDALVEFVKNGKLNFRDLAESIISDLIRIQVRQAAVGLFSAFAGGFTGGAAASSGIGSIAAGSQGPVSVLGQSVFLPGRANGGPVSPGGMYRINERGDPEVLTAAGKQYLLMNQSRGQVTPLESARGAAGATVPDVTVNITTPPGARVDADASTRMDGDRLIVDVLLKDVSQNGPATQAIGRAFGIQRKPR